MTVDRLALVFLHTTNPLNTVTFVPNSWQTVTMHSMHTVCTLYILMLHFTFSFIKKTKQGPRKLKEPALLNNWQVHFQVQACCLNLDSKVNVSSQPGPTYYPIEYKINLD